MHVKELEIAKQLKDEVKSFDTTRPVTEAICGFGNMAVVPGMNLHLRLLYWILVDTTMNGNGKKQINENILIAL